jgi:hypothetical protein
MSEPEEHFHLEFGDWPPWKDLPGEQKPKAVPHSDPTRLAVYMLGGALVGYAAGQPQPGNLLDPMYRLAPYPQMLVFSIIGLLCYLAWRLIDWARLT